MSSTGIFAKYVNVQKMTLTNLSDNLKYTQITNLIFDIMRASHFKSLMDGSMERLFGVANNALEFDIMLTVPEVAGFVNLTQIVDPVTDRKLPVKAWRITGTSIDNSVFNIDFIGSVVALRTIRPNAGASEQHVRIESRSIAVTVS